VRRISIVGPSGSGKSTVGRALADRLGVPFIELDAIHHLSGWTPIDPEEFRHRLGEITSQPRWVIDGNYGAVVRDGPVWERADTVVWLDLPRPLVMRQVIRRTLGRAVRREELWNGNRERWSNLFRWDPDQSIIRWAWTTHRLVRDRYEARSTDRRHGHLTFVRLRTRGEVEEWLASVQPSV
jgi:adenylate kinase family enzyme